jgi:RHS repeat-associated protein
VLGSPMMRTNAAGALLQTTVHEPYGATASGWDVPPRVGYTGHVNDPETGLVYMQQRYHDPIAGRFLSVDPITTDANTGNDFNRYVYALNNPFRFIDPDGRKSICTGTRLGQGCSTGGGISFASSGSSQSFGDAGSPESNRQGLSDTAGDRAFVEGARVVGAASVEVASLYFPVLRTARFGSAAKGVPQLAAPVMHQHHLMPRQFKEFFGKRGIDIDAHVVSLGEKSHLTGVHGKGLGNMPGGWNKEWAGWISKNPNASAKDVYQQLGTMMDRYKINDLPIHPYKP